jgi:uncharacterized protein
MLEALNMTMLDIALAGVTICLAVAAQSAVGFGSALFAAPVLVLIGIPLPNVIAMVATCSMLQATVGAYKLRKSIPWSIGFRAVGVMLIGFACGLLALTKLTELGPKVIRAAMGGLLCALVGLQALWKTKPAPRVHWGWGGLAFLSSGFLAGTCGMSGPPLVLWTMAHDWDARKTRGFLFAFFAMANPILILVLGFKYGPSVVWSVLLSMAYLPLVYLGSAIGLPIGDRMKKERLRMLAFALLLVIGVSALVPVLIGGLR